MKRNWIKTGTLLFMSSLLVLGGCSSASKTPEAEKEDQTVQETREPAAQESEDKSSKNILIVSFSKPTGGENQTDTDTSASVVIEDGKLLGNAEYAARLIAQETGAEWVRLQTIEDYPDDYETLVDQGKEEQAEQARPELQEVPDLSGIDTVILVSPNWWGDLPMPVYSFLDAEDWSGKTLIPVIISGGSGFSNVLLTLGEYAQVNEEKAQAISRSSLLSSEESIKEWAAGL